MPSVSGYRKGFGLKKGGVIDGFRVARVDVGHEQIEKYERYIYPTSLHLSAAAGPGVTAERAVEAVRTLTGGEHARTAAIDGQQPQQPEADGPPHCTAPLSHKLKG